MDTTRNIYDEQATLWNGLAGRAWVEQQALLDHMFQPLEKRLCEAVIAESAGRVLDVGCGTGSTTLAIDRLLGPRNTCVGIDISEPMIAAARVRGQQSGTRASFIHADAQTYAFDAATFDTIVSRLGVMFFANPVAAFLNLRRAAKKNARLHFIAWRSKAQNPFMTTAERAAAPLLQNVPARPADGPGQFAFADPRTVHGILGQSGWVSIEIRPLDLPCTLPEKDLIRYFTWLGPLGLILHEANDQVRARVIETVRAAFEPFVDGTEVRFTAACWMIRARAPSAAGEEAADA
jgi:SAM-dependent methyltransferase